MSSYDFAQYADHITVATSEMRPVTPELEPNPLLMYLRKNLQEAAEREKETNMALATLTVEADAVTRERIAIERAIKAYQQDPRNKLTADEIGTRLRETT
jgi:hypothetical protein